MQRKLFLDIRPTSALGRIRFFFKKRFFSSRARFLPSPTLFKTFKHFLGRLTSAVFLYNPRAVTLVRAPWNALLYVRKRKFKTALLVFALSSLTTRWLLLELVTYVSSIVEKGLHVYIFRNSRHPASVGLSTVWDVTNPNRFEDARAYQNKSELTNHPSAPTTPKYPDSGDTLFLNLGWMERESSEMFNLFFASKLDLRNLLLEYGLWLAPLQPHFPVFGFVELYFNFLLFLFIQKSPSIQS